MTGGHVVRDVTKLYEDSKSLYNELVLGSVDGSVDSLLNHIFRGIEILKGSWKGKDASVQINNAVTGYNELAEIRNNLALLSKDVVDIAKHYREIQLGNRASGEELQSLNVDSTRRQNLVVDNSDTIDISPEAMNGREQLKSACDLFPTSIANVRTKFNDILENWVTGGNKRVEFQKACDYFLTVMNRYNTTLQQVLQSITTAIDNYNM